MPNQSSVNQFHFAFDGNEANVSQRVGSNVYAFEILKALREKITADPQLKATVLLRQPLIADWPKPNASWQYKVIKPSFLWTQFAAPIHLFLNQKKYDAFYTPGHYAPRLCPLPYLSSVMDLAYLKYPTQYRHSDLIQLKKWTRYSLKRAEKIVTISHFTKQDIIQTYKIPPEKIVVAPPAVKAPTNIDPKLVKEFFQTYHLEKPYFLFVGTFQPRKNLKGLIEAYELFCRRNSEKKLPQLVLAGKIGWFANPILERIKKSPFSQQIITPGFVTDEIKTALYQQATASILLGFYEGFGLPPLESLAAGCIPIVADNSSLPEAVGEAGIKVDPKQTKDIALALEKTCQFTPQQKKKYLTKAKQQLARFSWEKSAQTILKTLREVTDEK